VRLFVRLPQREQMEMLSSLQEVRLSFSEGSRASKAAPPTREQARRRALLQSLHHSSNSSS